jgi:hypothetical protein
MVAFGEVDQVLEVHLCLGFVQTSGQQAAVRTLVVESLGLFLSHTLLKQLEFHLFL